jgi:hypothetical protein
MPESKANQRADSAQLLCVCGHPEADHIDERPFLCQHRRTFNDDPVCLCGEFRPALPWPDSAGWWWSDYHGVLECAKWSESGDFRVCYHGAWLTHVMLQASYSRALRFTKCEPNPFAAPGGEG